MAQDEWGLKKYIKTLHLHDAVEVMKTRLHMIPLPCNYGRNEGCLVCGSINKIQTEHYLTCQGTVYLRKKSGIKATIYEDIRDDE